MKVLKLSALILGAFLFTGIGATALSAQTKCGAGKSENTKMGTPKVCNSDENCKCDCKGKKGADKSMKCGSAKCGGSDNSSSKGKVCNSKDGCKCECQKMKDTKKKMKKDMKCGTGKCG